jgi:ABC-2 type transport system permease protein
MNIFRFELRQGWKSAVIWALSLSAVAALYISIFPSVHDQAGVADIAKGFPEVFKKAFNITDDYLTVFPSIYAVILSIVTLAGAIQAMNLGVGIISKEVRDKTADFLLTKPIGRFSVQAQKFLAAIILLLLTDVIFFTIVWGLIKAIITDPFPFKTFLSSTSIVLLLQAFFLSLGYLLGSVLPKVKTVIAVSLPVVFGFYVLGLLDTVVGENKIKYLTPFKMFNINELTAGKAYDENMLIYLGVLVVVFTSASFIVYRRRDIHTV